MKTKLIVVHTAESASTGQLAAHVVGPGPTTVFIDEFDTARFQSSTDDVERGPSRCVNTCLKLADCHNAYPGTLCQFQLAPINQAARRS